MVTESAVVLCKLGSEVVAAIANELVADAADVDADAAVVVMDDIEAASVDVIIPLFVI